MSASTFLGPTNLIYYVFIQTYIRVSTMSDNSKMAAKLSDTIKVWLYLQSYYTKPKSEHKSKWAMRLTFGFCPPSAVIYWQMKLFLCLLSANKNSLSHTNAGYWDDC